LGKGEPGLVVIEFGVSFGKMEKSLRWMAAMAAYVSVFHAVGLYT
jgi:hypothetical protein